VHSSHFTFFLWLILLLWYINLINEAQELLRLVHFLYHVRVVNRWPFLTRDMKRFYRSWSNRLRFDVPSLAGSWQTGDSAAAPAHRVSQRNWTWSPSSPSHHGPPDDQAATYNEATPLLGHLVSRHSTKNVTGFSGTEEGYNKMEILEFARPHFYTCICIVFIRTGILLLIGYAGTNFLLSNKTVLDLLLNALALAFIFELDEFLFEYLLSDQSKELVDQLAPLRYKSRARDGFCVSFVSERIVWGTLFIPSLAALVVYLHNTYSVAPYIEALECLCLQTGDRCLVNIMFYTSWWDDYWSKMAALK